MQLKDLNVGCVGAAPVSPAFSVGSNPIRAHAERRRHDVRESASPASFAMSWGWPPWGRPEAALALRGRGQRRRVLLSRRRLWNHDRLAGHTGGTFCSHDGAVQRDFSRPWRAPRAARCRCGYGPSDRAPRQSARITATNANRTKLNWMRGNRAAARSTIWLEPDVRFIPRLRGDSRVRRPSCIGRGAVLYEPDAAAARRGAEALADMRGPIISFRIY